jgi:hypothetical protein
MWLDRSIRSNVIQRSEFQDKEEFISNDRVKIFGILLRRIGYPESLGGTAVFARPIWAFS